MKQVLAFILIIISSFIYANEFQEIFPEKDRKIVWNRREKYPAAINLYALGPIGLIGVSFDYFINQKLNIEAGAGIRSFENDPGFTLGLKYNFLGKTPLNLTPYVGIFNGFEPTENSIRNYNIYIPFGLHRLKRDRFTWSVEVAFQYNVYRKDEYFFGGFRMGYRFGFKKKGLFKKK
ncbi:hypothetical protein [Crocinitomix algicola]|uniref:hypothetical protein n=1 Tax=Crocinitomix algicola TaxID=1740263 RepID=UPI0008349629|nr:hypothetical protein [Crocinitomix algicola]